MAYVDFKDWRRRAASDKILEKKVFNIAKILNIMVIKEELDPMVYKFFDKKSAGSGIANNKIN